MHIEPSLALRARGEPSFLRKKFQEILEASERLPVLIRVRCPRCLQGRSRGGAAKAGGVIPLYRQ